MLATDTGSLRDERVRRMRLVELIEYADYL
jgi:hypothetical protein